MGSSPSLGNLLGTWAVRILFYALVVGFLFAVAVWTGYFGAIFVGSPRAAIRMMENESSRPRQTGIAALGDTKGDRVEGILLGIIFPIILIGWLVKLTCTTASRIQARQRPAVSLVEGVGAALAICGIAVGVYFAAVSPPG